MRSPLYLVEQGSRLAREGRRLVVSKEGAVPVRVQRSVFELYITPQHLERLQARLAKLHKAEEDSIRFYFLCATCRPKGVYLGPAQPIEEPGLRIL